MGGIGLTLALVVAMIAFSAAFVSFLVAPLIILGVALGVMALSERSTGQTGARAYAAGNGLERDALLDKDKIVRKREEGLKVAARPRPPAPAEQPAGTPEAIPTEAASVAGGAGTAKAGSR